MNKNTDGAPHSSMNGHEQKLYVEAILRTMRQPLVVLDSALRVETANRAFYEGFQVAPESTLGQRLYDLGNGQWNIPELKHLLEGVLPDRRDVKDFRVEHEFDRIGRRVMMLNAHLMGREGHNDRILLEITDVTEEERQRWELEGQKEFAEKIVDASRDALLILGWDLRVKIANETFYETFKVDRAATEGQMVYDLGNGQWNIPRLRELLENVLPENDTFDDFEVAHEFEDLGPRIMVLNARRVDHMNLILLAIEDQTETRRATAALAESEAKFRILIESTANAVWEADPEGRMLAASSWQSFTGQGAEAIGGEEWLDALHPDDRSRFLQEWENCVTARQALKSEVRLRHSESGWRWTRCNAAPVYDRNGKLAKWVGMNTDITPRKKAEEQRELLLGELNHRVKNLFSVVRALASQGNKEQSGAEYRRVFLGRLDALVKAHALAFEGRWERVDLAKLSEQTMRPYCADRPEAVEMQGEALQLEARSALSLSLVLHELATNAVKYGALSSPEGKVHLRWQARARGEEEREIHLTWREVGGPPVAPPARAGFGTQLVERVLQSDLDGKSAIEFHEDGLRLEARFPHF